MKLPIGSIIIADYATFGYTIYEGSNVIDSSSGYHVLLAGEVAKHPKNYDIEFKVKLSDEQDNRLISIESGSHMFFIGSKNTGVNIVMYVDLQITHEVSLNGGASDFVYFKTHLDNFKLSSSGNGEYSFTLNAVLIGTIAEGTANEAPLGQNIPFVSIRVTMTD